ncbi:hypothetical protein OTU49_001773, partial [Cherax quadricarinatus]
YEYWKMAVENKESGVIYAHEELPAEVKLSSVLVHGSGLNNNSQPSSQTSSPIPIRSDFGSSDMSTSGYQSSTQALIDLEDSSDTVATDPSKDSKLQNNACILNKPWDSFDDTNEINDGFSRLALRREDQTLLLGTFLQTSVDLNLAALKDHPAASQIENGFSQSASSPSSTASSPTDPWLLGQSPPDVWEDFSRSPNMAFLHSCQSPPSQTAFSQSLNLKYDPFVSCETTKDQFVFCKTVKDPLHTRDPFVPCKTVNNSDLSKMPEFNCRIPDPFMQLNCVNDPFALNISKDALTCAGNTFSPSLPEKSLNTCPISGCGSSQPVWGNDIFDTLKGKNVKCT